MAIPNTTIVHTFGATSTSSDQGASAQGDLGANLALTSGGPRYITLNPTASRDVQLPNPADTQGQTRTIVNVSAIASGFNLVVKQWNSTAFSGAPVGTIRGSAAQRTGVTGPVLTTPGAMTFFSTGSTWICIGVGYPFLSNT